MSKHSNTLDLDRPNPRVVLTGPVHGDLSVGGWESSQIKVVGDDAAFDEEIGADGEVRIRVRGGGLRLPAGASLVVGAVHGDLRIKGISGTIQADDVFGDCKLRDVGATRLGQVHGDLRAGDVAGGLTADAVHGDAVVRGCAGDVNLERVGADFLAREVRGSVRASAGADISAELGGGADHKLRAGADIRGVLADGFVGRLTAESGADSVRVDLAEGRATQESPADGGAGVWHVGAAASPASSDEAGEGIQVPMDGPGSIELEAGADILVTEASAGSRETRWQARAEFQALGEEFRQFGHEMRNLTEGTFRRMQDQMQGVGGHWSSRLQGISDNLVDILSSAGLGLEEAEAIADKVRRAGERAGERARRHIERGVAHGRHRDGAPEGRRGSWEWIGRVAAPGAPTPPTPPAAPVPPAPPIPSTEERMAILRLLENGKINVDEAARLLAALEGRLAAD